jgi:RNA polymerase sigma-70 factor, ECF subfamily
MTMTIPPVSNLNLFIEQAYTEARSIHGDLLLSFDEYRLQIHAILERYDEQAGKHAESQTFLVSRLHLIDLYLACACARANEEAWKRFSRLYHKSILEAAFVICRDRCQADELAWSVMGHLFLPDAKGLPRINSYNGLSSLMSWLRTVISHKALDEHRLQSRYAKGLDELSDMVDETGIRKAQRRVRTSIYASLITAVFREVPQVLSEREKLILLLRYKDKMKMCDIAKMIGTSPPNLTYHLKHAQKKIKREVVTVLRRQHKLSQAAVEECIDEILENPFYSLLEAIQ